MLQRSTLLQRNIVQCSRRTAVQQNAAPQQEGGVGHGGGGVCVRTVHKQFIFIYIFFVIIHKCKQLSTPQLKR
jgi:hypothetical protein